ncbi:hypothetical protein L7F22_042584 [Adiantum nelumboides]|nr:hypothetical protein [Adiantum nelumboides]
MAVSFPTFYGHHDENARDFMDSLEMAHLMAERDQEEVKLRAFPLVLKGEARVWYDALAPPSKATWPTLYGAFLNKYGLGDTPENLWKQLLQHRQGSLGDYKTYESKFTNLWERWAASLQGQGGAPNFLKRDKFVEGLSITEPSDCHAKLANNSKVKCLGIIKDVHITILDVSAKVDFYVMPSKREGYPLILGRPWLMEVNADQKWGSGKLVLQKGKRIVYDMKLGKQSNIYFETSTDKKSSDESSYGDEESYTSEESSMEVMGLVFQQPQAKGSSTSKEVEVVAKEEPMMEERLRKMLSKDLTKEEEEDYINMFKRYPHLFITDYSMIKGVDVIQHHIDLKPDAKPVAQKLRRLGVVQQEALLTEVNKLLKADYKPLNAATKRDHFPLPFQDEILNEVAGHERYTVCDGYSGYYQIRIAEEDQHKTTFITPWGCFAFRVMPFGLTNAPSTFTRFTSFIFQPFFGKSIRVFLDDFCTYSDRALHCQRVEEGLQRLYQYGGQLNPNKCHVAEKEVVLLGHVISQESIKVDPSRVQAILDLPPPNSARQVLTFVQKVRYMSRFIHLLSQIISPLQQLANQEVFSWEQEHLECFNEVKEVLGSLPTIMPPDPQGIYYLCPSVGLDAFGAVLMQKDPRTSYMRPIYFTSKVMTQGQKGYTDIEQLVFSLIVAIRKFRSYLLPKSFIILTLEHNLPYAIQHMSISSKISKWVLELQEYEYTFIVEDSTRASLADVLTYKVKEKKITPKAQVKLDLSPQGELEDAYTLLFDGAYRRQRNKAVGRFVILNEEKKEVLKKGIQLHLAHSNNEAEYATLKAGLEECKSMGIRRIMVKGDALLIVRQVQGTWACKNSKLLQWLHEVKLLMKDFEAIQIQHISRQHNKEADNMANTQFEVMVGAIKFKEPLFQGQETMEDILYFLETGECPKHLERVQRHRLVRNVLSYQLIGEHLYHKGKDLVLRRVPLVKEIEIILMSCHDGVCGGHFAQEITSRKILQAGFVWPSLHRDVQHWCKACKASQQAGDRKLSYGPRFPIFAYGPFEKWGIDAIGPLPRTSTGKQYILTATDYMTRWAKAASVARITAADVRKFVLDYIYSRFGAPLEILSDRVPGFRVDLLDALLDNLSIQHVHSTPYYPQCNGLVEKTNGVLCKIITKHVRDRPQDWDKHLTAALWAYRTSFKVSTQFTPYHLVYGQEALLPIEVELGSLRVLAREATSSKEKLEQRILDLQRLELDREAASDYYITQANKKREQLNNKFKEKKLEEGMLVMRYDSWLDLSHSKKFLQRWEGP